MFNKYKSRGFGQYERKIDKSEREIEKPEREIEKPAYARGGTVYTYAKPTPPMPHKDIPNCYLHPVLQLILETKRPTKEAAFCLDFICNLLDAADIAYSIDKAGNVSVDIDHADDTMSDVCFTSHTDTVDNKLGTNELEVKGNIVYVKGGGVLGADCGTGMYIMIRMIQELVPGHYVFFATEEAGRVGSKQYFMPDHITKCISFDRKGYDNLITTQSGRKGCSDEFANALIAEFGVPLVKDPGGTYTDSYTFFDSINECINLSVGYFNQHTQYEYQDIEFLPKLVEACIKMDWDSLPAVRDPLAELRAQSLRTQSYGYGKAYNPYGFEMNDDEDDDYYYGREWASAYKQNTPFLQRSEKAELEDFCFNNYNVVAAILTEYGITVTDCEAYKLNMALERKQSLSSGKGG